jgi:hypothetical protein
MIKKIQRVVSWIIGDSPPMETAETPETAKNLKSSSEAFQQALACGTITWEVKYLNQNDSNKEKFTTRELK